MQLLHNTVKMYKHNKGTIKESAIKALVRDPLFSARVEKPKKGKGSYSRKNQKRNWDF